MITRRKLLWSGLGVAGVAGIGLLGFGRLGLEAEIVSVLRRRLAFLRLDEQGLHAFAKDQVTALLSRRLPTWNRWRYHFQSSVSASYNRFSRSTDTRSRTAKVEDKFISMYLMSSDFFIRGANESLPVLYMAFYDPLRACGNPFARPPPGANT